MNDTLFFENSQVIQQTLPVHAVVCSKIKEVDSGESFPESFKVRILGVEQKHQHSVATEVQTLTHTSLASS